MKIYMSEIDDFACRLFHFRYSCAGFYGNKAEFAVSTDELRSVFFLLRYFLFFYRFFLIIFLLLMRNIWWQEAQNLAENFHRTIALGLENALCVYIKFRLSGDGVSMFLPCVCCGNVAHTYTCRQRDAHSHAHTQTQTQTVYICQSLMFVSFDPSAMC